MASYEETAFHSGYVPLMSTESTLIDSSMFEKIFTKLPSIMKLRDWTLIYSTANDGYSMNNLLRKAENSGANVLIIRDEAGHVFGGFTNESWRMSSRSYYGNGDCFLFTFHDSKQISAYAATWANDYFMCSDAQFISMGAGGNPGFSISSDLLNGTSYESETFRNECLSHNEFFRILDIELWSLKS